jgi:hypothetical protein
MKNRVLFITIMLALAALLVSTRVQIANAFDWGAFFRGQPQNTSQSATAGNAFNSKPANLRLSLNSLLKEHAVMAAAYLTGLYMDMENERLLELMDANRDQLASRIETTYNSQTGDAFSELWTQHMLEYRNYTLALKENDEQAMNEARQNLAVIANDLGELLDSKGNNLNAPTVTSLMMEHVNGTLSIVDAVAESDTAQAADLMKMGYDQAGRFADALARGMINDNPNMVK